MSRNAARMPEGADYSAWHEWRLARRLAAADAADTSSHYNHLITVVVFPTKSRDNKAISATLTSLRSQRYGNFEVLVTGGFGGVRGPKLADASGFNLYRGLFTEPSLSPEAILADPAHDDAWRGGQLVFAPAGTLLAPDMLLLFNAALQASERGLVPELVLCDHDRVDAGGVHHYLCRTPGWKPKLVRQTDYLGSAFMASRGLIESRRGGPPPASLHDWLCRVAQKLTPLVFRHIPEPLVHYPPNSPVERLDPDEVDQSDKPRATPVRPGLCLLGHLRAQDGLGQAARMVAQACDTSRLPMSLYHLPVPQRNNDPEFATKCTSALDREANLLVAGLATLPTLTGLNPNRFNILYPYWEVPRVPAKHMEVVESFDEVWAATRFIASMFGDDCTRPVEIVPQPLRLPATLPPPRNKRDALRFFTFFHFDSNSNRKNPNAAVEAFRAAFPPARRDVELVVKAHGTNDLGMRDWLARAAAEDPRITIVDRTLERDEMDALMADCDAFISLHRAEGFGFGAAEALAAGKAVVSTDYSGTTDFISAKTGYPVECDLVPVPPKAFMHTEGQVWAAPHRDSAVAALRAIYDDPDEADRRAARGFALLRKTCAPEVVGRRIHELLELRGIL